MPIDWSHEELDIKSFWQDFTPVKDDTPYDDVILLYHSFLAMLTILSAPCVRGESERYGANLVLL